MDGTGLASGQVELVIAVKRIGLQDAGVVGQVTLRMLAFAIG
jgi:hypothetical protein